MKKIVSLLVMLSLSLFCVSFSAADGDTIICRECGKAIPNYSNYCLYCGTAVDTTQSTASHEDAVGDYTLQIEQARIYADVCKYDEAYDILQTIPESVPGVAELLAEIEPYHGLLGKWEIDYDSMKSSDGLVHVVPYRFLYLESITNETISYMGMEFDTHNVHFRNIIQSGIGKVEYADNDPWKKWFTHPNFVESSASLLLDEDGHARLSVGSSTSDNTFRYKSFDAIYTLVDDTLYAEFSFWTKFAAMSAGTPDITVTCTYYKSES